MSGKVSERSLEEAIERALLRHGPDASPDEDEAVIESSKRFLEPLLTPRSLNESVHQLEKNKRHNKPLQPTAIGITHFART